MKTVRIGVDADGTGYDLMNPWLDLWFRETGRKYTASEIVKYNPHKVLGENGGMLPPDETKLFYDLLEREGLFLNLPTYPHFLDVMKEMYHNNFEVHMVSKPAGPNSAGEKIRAFLRDMPWLTLDKIALISPKHLFDLDILVDDAPEHAEKIRNARPGTLIVGIRQPWNVEHSHLWHFLASDWKELHAFLVKWRDNIPSNPTPERMSMYNEYMGNTFGQ